VSLSAQLYFESQNWTLPLGRCTANAYLATCKKRIMVRLGTALLGKVYSNCDGLHVLNASHRNYMFIPLISPPPSRRLYKRKGGGGGHAGGGHEGGDSGGSHPGSSGSHGGDDGGSGGSSHPTSGDPGSSDTGSTSKSVPGLGSASVTLYGSGGGSSMTIPSGDLFSGRSEGGGTRDEVFGTQ
jgi:hypothetical protein